MKSWVASGLTLGLIASCGQEYSELSPIAQVNGETVTFSLNAEISVEEPDLRTINYQLDNNAKGQLVPMPQFTDGQLVEVHTVLKNIGNREAVAKTLKWRYDAKKKKLILKPTSKDISKDENNIIVSNSRIHTGWYISGMIGGVLEGTKVRFEGSRELKGVEGNKGDIIDGLNVPYAFGWTELIVKDTAENKTEDGSYKYAETPADANIKFSPLGSLIAYKLGNAQRAGEYTFTPSHLIVTTNTFRDKGTFDLNYSLTIDGRDLPRWTVAEDNSHLTYRLSPTDTPDTMPHASSARKTYYAWVMPTEAQGTSFTRVRLRGESSRLATETYQDITKIWATDYYKTDPPKVVQGRVHQLRADVVYPMFLPIQFFSEQTISRPYRRGVEVRSVDFQRTIDEEFGPNKYHVPTLEEWWGVFPYRQVSLSWSGSSIVNRTEEISFDFPYNLYLSGYRSDYSEGKTIEGGARVRYAIRFQKHGTNPNAYQHASDDWLKSAFRFAFTPEQGLTIDVAYLGEEAQPTSLSTISDESWWVAKRAEGAVISRRYGSGGSWAVGGSTFNAMLSDETQMRSAVVWNLGSFLGVRLFRDNL